MKSILNVFFLVVIFLGFQFVSFCQHPLTANFENSAANRWLNKKVLDTRKLDDMETLDSWQGYTVGGEEIVDARKVFKVSEASNVAAISLSKEQVHSGNTSLLMRTPVRLPAPPPANGRGWGRSGIRRDFNGENWTKYNRISIWIYPDLPGFYTSALDIHLFNDGIKKIPALFGQEGETSLVLNNHQWNHIVWEIDNVARDKVTKMEISYGLSGNAPEEADSIQFYFDGLDLEQVAPDKTEGWDVWKDRISYSHDGYQTGGEKSAVASGLSATGFKLINQDNGDVVLEKPIETQSNHSGNFQVMDFSEVRKPGNYVLQAGGLSTHPFPIGNNIWEASVWKALNFFYTERCGAAVPGVHGVCHRDWSCTHNNKRIIINGGWHDAGDLTQGLGNTAEIDYGLFSLAERLHARNENPALYDRLMEEARWGLDWIIKTSFGDGFRNTGSISSRRTNGILGDDDDVTSTARNNPQDNFLAAAAEAIGASVLKEADPRLAALALKMAEADWKFGIEGMATENKPSKELFSGSFDSENIEFEAASEAILAAVDIWKLTGNKKYEEKAVSLSQLILNCQERKKTDWDVPLIGFFYAGVAKDRILHFVHRGREQAHILALTELCHAFPDHPDYMKWYSAVTLYDEYVKTVVKYTEPYGVLPASIYCDSEYVHTPESRRESFKQQVLNGVPLGKGHYLRLFPVWMDYRGHFGTILPQAQALVNVAHLRGDFLSTQIAAHQLEWIIGRNPFSQSTMFGEGYDFPPLYTPSSGDMVGALPVGIQTKGDNDEPYWPVQSTWTYKEVWVHPVARWIWLMRDLSGPALIEGQATASVTFKEIRTGEEIVVQPDAAMHFRSMLPEGSYIIASGGVIQTKIFLPAATYNIDLRPAHALNFDVSTSTTNKGDIIINVKADGNGVHHFTIRADNLTFVHASKEVILKSGQTGTIEWHAHVTSPDTPWVALVIPDDDLQQKKELMGAAWKK
ncbi:MAG: glycoside hydrolase family 9 protein [Bacteroidota bacterium]